MMIRTEGDRRRIPSSSSTKSALPIKGPIPELVRRRVRDGCIIPSISAVSKSALQALEDRVHQVLPHSLLSAKRVSALALVPDNGVPETLIVECVISDSPGTYVDQYSKAAKRALKDGGMSSIKAARKAAIQTYRDYLTSSNGIFGKTGDTSSATHASTNGGGTKGKAIDQKKVTAALLFHSTFGDKLLSKRPFKESAANAVYCKTRKDLFRAFDSVQRYAYYMRPDDPMNRSEDTATRLDELLRYVYIVYRCLIYFMDTMDAKALKAAGYVPSVFGPRESQTPDRLFVQYARSGSSASPRGGITALVRLTHDAMLCLIKLCALCSAADWKGKVGRGGVSACTEAALAVVDLITLAHHHCQYLLNLTLVGYACWLRGGINDLGILSAIRQQGRYCHFFGNLAPTATSHSWALMEVGTEWWLKLAVAKGIARYGGPTPHYLLTTDTGNHREPGPGSRLCRRRPGSAVVRRTERSADENVSGALFLGESNNNRGDGNARGDGRYEHDFKWLDRSNWNRRSLRRVAKVTDISTADDDSDYTSKSRPFQSRSRSMRVYSRNRQSCPTSSCRTTNTILFQESRAGSDFSAINPPQLPPRNESLADRGRLRLIASTYHPIHQSSLGPLSDSEYDSGDPENTDCSNNPNDDAYWYTNHLSQSDTCAFAGDPDPDDSFFGKRYDVADVEFWSAEISPCCRDNSDNSRNGASIIPEDEEDAEGCCDDARSESSGEEEATYVSMEEIERTMEKQRSESARSPPEENNRNCIHPTGDPNCLDHQRQRSDYDVPRRCWDRANYDVPKFFGDVSYQESIYDVPRKAAIPRVVNAIDSSGENVQYDVPRPITILFAETEKRKRQSV